MDSAQVAAQPITYAVAAPATAAPVYAPAPTYAQPATPASLAPVVQGYAPQPVQYGIGGQSVAPVQYAPYAAPQYLVAPPMQQQYVQQQQLAERFNVGQAPTQQQPNVTLSSATVDVINALGIEAPAKLNSYALTLEDAILKQHAMLQQAQERMKAMETILTDPDQLSKYTVEYFTHVVPVETAAPAPAAQPQYTEAELQAAYAQQAAEQQAAEQQAAYEQQVAAQQQYQYSPQTPQIPMGAGQNGTPAVKPAEAWANLRRMAQVDPKNAWRYLNQMPADAFSSKILVVDQG